jgi:hypothetical protein
MPSLGRSDVHPTGLQPPTDLRVVEGSSTSLTLEWSAGRGVKGFELFRDDLKVASTTETSFTFTGLSCGTAYALTIEAFDAAGRRSELASVIAASDACVEPDPPVPTSPPTPSVPGEPMAPAVEPSPGSPPSVAPPPTTPESPGTRPELEASSTQISWAGAGAFVWHETDVSPEALGVQLRENGFSWVAVLIHDGTEVDPVEGDWVRRFRAASRLPVGGWGVLRTEPELEAELAHRLLDHNSLDFYIANPEAEYKFSSDDGQSGERYGRSQRFVDSFRALEQDTPAAISSYCRADTQDIDWGAWNDSGFVFLPQAYVNDFGGAASPAACAEGAAEFFPPNAVHPTVGVYAGQEGEPSPERYVALLEEAGTVGFSVYLAETRMHPEHWRTYGDAIAEFAIARGTAGATSGDGAVSGAPVDERKSTPSPKPT